jgi:hypothetical protein
VTTYDEQRLAGLIRLLAPAPAGWVRAAQELPVVRAGLDGIAERARADAGYRAAVVADLESALARVGIEPEARAVEALRRRIAE